MSFIGITNYKTPSIRCPNKHHKEFYNGKNLVDIKIEQLQASKVDHIYISTNDTDVTNTDNITYINREQRYCDESLMPFSEVTQQIFNSIPVDDHINAVFTFTMCPLFARYDEMYDQFKRSGKNQLAVYPSRHFYMDRKKLGVNFMFGPWQAYSQDIDPLYQSPACGALSTMGDHRKAGYHIPINFEYFEIETYENLDIDTEEEFEVGQMLYKWKLNRS